MARIEPKQVQYKHNVKTYLELVKGSWPLFIALLVTTLVIEVSQAIDKFFFKAIIDQGTLFVAGDLSKATYTQLLLLLAASYALVNLIRAVLRWLKIHQLNHLEVTLMKRLKIRFFNHIVQLSHNFHTTNKTGSLISRLIRGSSAIERFTDVIIFSFGPLIFQFATVFFSIIYFDLQSALVVAGIVGVFIAYSFFILRKQIKYKVIANNTEDIEKANISDFFMNIESIKYFGKEDRIMKRYERLAENSKKTRFVFWQYFRWFDAGQTIILGAGTILVIWFPLTKLLAGEMSIGSVVFIYTIFSNLFGPLFSFVHGIRGFYQSMADFESLFRYEQHQNEIKNGSQKKFVVRKGQIEFKELDFNYPKHNKLFRNFSLTINPNSKVALVGHSGCGKTTLVKLLYRLYDPLRGKILIDGKDITQYQQETLRSEMSIVPQEAVLFDDTIFNNIAFSRPSATRKEVLQAIKFAQLDKIIDSFPLKEKTIVGERGVKLSGGEKQRVSIARAVLANKKILVLDEATSALDSKTEHEIQKDLERLMKGRTSIIIAHRLSTIMKADEIIVMQRGKIVQRGTHNELIKIKGRYRELWNLQKGGYIA
ncbi:MAG: ABC transporter ATP-binding protein [Candidatus Woesearchaeota archaeon]|nr:MAG: ABC transporter ATP-binding protein [Candidatus Woesearchaeota archaeon]